MEYKTQVIKGISWFGILRFITKTVGFLEAIILARILLPEQFGAYGIALLTLGVLEVITESGVNIVLVQEKEIDEHINSAWIISILRGVLISLVLIVSSPFISNFFRSPESLAFIYLISAVPFIRGFINPSIVKLQKELLFVKDFWVRFLVLLVDTVISIIVTYTTQNPLGILVGLISGVLLELFLSFIIISPRPQFRIENQYLKKIFNRGKWVTISSIFDYLFHNADNIAVGRILGAQSLGIYQMAYSLSAGPIIEVGRVFVHVMVPVFIKISNEEKRLKNAYAKTLLTISLLTFPFVLIFSFFPSFLVSLLGDKWSGIINILPILAILGFIKSVSLSANALFISKNKQEYTSVITFVNILGMIISIVPLIATYNLLGAGLAALIGSVSAIPFIIMYTKKIFNN